MSKRLSEYGDLARIRIFLQSPTSFVGLFTFPAICAVILWTHFPVLYSSGWLAITYIATLMRLLVWWHVRRRAALSDDADSLYRMVRLTVLSMFIVGVAWGTLGTSILLVDDIHAKYFIALTVFGMSSATVFATSAWLPATLAYVLPMAAPLTISLIGFGQAHFMALGFGLVFYLTLIMAFVRRYSQWFDEFVELQVGKAQLVNDLVEARDAANAANAAKSGFLANMSHEFRTPLNAILGFSEIIKDGLMDRIPSAHVKEYAKYIHESGEHLLQLVNSVLDYSKIEAGKTELCIGPFSLNHAVVSCVGIMRQTALRHDVHLTHTLPDQDILLEADELRLRQIMLNLLSNAIKFTPPGGTVKASVEKDGNWAIIAVQDTGIGMSPEDLKTALEPFGQVTSAQHENLRGTGLGLPLAKSLVEMHGGTMDVESRKGHGTTIRVRLPRADIGMRPSNSPEQTNKESSNSQFADA